MKYLFNILALSSLIISACQNLEPDKKGSDLHEQHYPALKELFSHVGFEDTIRVKLKDKLNIILVPGIGCQTCFNRFNQLINTPLKEHTYIFSEAEIHSEETPIFHVENNFLMRLNLKTQSGMVYISYTDKIEHIEKITAFNIDSLFLELSL